MSKTIETVSRRERVASHKTVPVVQLERFHGLLEIEVLLLYVLQQLVVDQIVVLEPDRLDDKGDEADEDRKVPDNPHPLVDHLADVHRLQDALSGVLLLHQAHLDHQPLEAKVEGEDEDQPEPCISRPPGGGDEVDDEQTEAVEYHSVQPTHLAHHETLKKVATLGFVMHQDTFPSTYLEPGDPVKHLEDHVPLLQGAQLELLHHLLHVAAAGLYRLAQDGAILHQLPAVECLS